ncbi:MAG: transglycosylase family protein [Acidimicrobiia bacterium]
MRNPFRSFLLLVGALLMTGMLLVGDVLAEPAHAISRRAPVGGSYHRSATTKVYRRRKVQRTSRSYRRVRRTAPAPAPVPVPVEGDVWAKLRQCESGGRYDINTGNGYYGAYQFLLSTWNGLGYPGYPHQASPEMQDEAAQKLQARSGWGQWPACTRRLGLR